MNLRVDPEQQLFTQVQVYESRTDQPKKHSKHMLVVARNQAGFAILRVLLPKVQDVPPGGHDQSDTTLITNKTPLHDLLWEEHPNMDEYELKAFLTKQQQTNRLVEVCSAHGIIGFTKFLEGYYMLVITKKETVAKLGEHKIYKITETKLIPLYESATSNATRQNEKKYYKTFLDFDLSFGFYFSHSYDLTNSLNENLRRSQENRVKRNTLPIYNVNNPLCWNLALVEELAELVTNRRWVMGIIHGYIEQQQIQHMTQVHSLTLIARRSRHHAGTRYLKRGINEVGYVANFVENEQIVIDQSFTRHSLPICSSFIQVRGSIPLFWHQEAHVYNPKPAIKIGRSDPYYLTTKAHLRNLLSRYGTNIFLVNLVKLKEKQPREQSLAEEYKTALKFINEEAHAGGQAYQWQYFPLDLKKEMKRDIEEFFKRTTGLALYFIMTHGLFSVYSDTRTKMEQRVHCQNGVIRSNCIDCLDRTNYFQQIVGEVALGLQLKRLAGQTADHLVFVDLAIAKNFRKMYERMGDTLSIQYGGSVAHKQSIMKQNDNSKTLEFITSIKRHLNNSFTDYYKQQTIDLFLRLFRPEPQGRHIWEQQRSITFYPDYLVLGHLEHSCLWIDKAIRDFKGRHLYSPSHDHDSHNNKHFLMDVLSQSFCVDSSDANTPSLFYLPQDQEPAQENYSYTIKLDPAQKYYTSPRPSKPIPLLQPRKDKLYTQTSFLPVHNLSQPLEQNTPNDNLHSLNHLEEVNMSLKTGPEEEEEQLDDHQILLDYLNPSAQPKNNYSWVEGAEIEMDSSLEHDYQFYVHHHGLEEDSLSLDSLDDPQTEKRTASPAKHPDKKPGLNIGTRLDRSSKIRVIEEHFRKAFGRHNKTQFHKI